jgi:hypothetical protein
MLGQLLGCDGRFYPVDDLQRRDWLPGLFNFFIFHDALPVSFPFNRIIQTEKKTTRLLF